MILPRVYGTLAAALLVAAQAEPVRIKEPDFDKVKRKFDAYEAAVRDFDSGAVDRALASARDLLKDPGVSGYADQLIQVVRLDRMTRQWSVPVGDPKPFYAKQLAARCLLDLARAETDATRKVALLEEARGLVSESRAEGSSRLETQIGAELDRARKATSGPREDPAAPAIREIKRLSDTKEFRAATELLEKNRSLLGDAYASLRSDVQGAEQRELSGLAAAARAFLEKLRPEEKIDSILRSLKAYLPDPAKFSAVGPELEWVGRLDAVLQKHAKAEYLDAAPPETLTRDLLALQKAAIEREDLGHSRAVIGLRMHASMGWVQAAAKAASAGPISELEGHTAKASKIVDGLALELAGLRKEAEQATDLGRKNFLTRVSDLFAQGAEPVAAAFAALPVAEPAALQEVRQALTTGGAPIFSPEGKGGYGVLAARLGALLSSEGSSGWHPEALIRARALMASLIALEGFRLGRDPDAVRQECRPYVGAGDLRTLLPPGLPAKVVRLLDPSRK